MFDDFLIPVAVVGGILGFFFLLVVGACLWEKHPVIPYYVPEEGEEYDESGKATHANDVAEELEYTHLAVLHDAKKLLRVRYDVWLSPDRAVIAVVGCGTVAKVPVNAIWFYSRPTGEKMLATTNEIGDQDISGAIAQQTWPGSGFEALATKHDRRLEDVTFDPFPKTGPMEMYFGAILRQKADTLVAKGYAKYIDADEAVWKYTLKGALVFYFMGTWVRPIRRFLRSLGLVKE